MALGFFLLIFHVGSLDYGVVFDAAESGELSDTVVTLVALGLLGGAVAKSAQIPFHTWLPGRDGGADTGLRPHPRGDDGDGRRLSHLPHESGLRGGAGRRSTWRRSSAS